MAMHGLVYYASSEGVPGHLSSPVEKMAGRLME